MRTPSWWSLPARGVFGWPKFCHTVDGVRLPSAIKHYPRQERQLVAKVGRDQIRLVPRSQNYDSIGTELLSQL